jgi:ribose transport system permease protein
MANTLSQPPNADSIPMVGALQASSARGHALAKFVANNSTVLVVALLLILFGLTSQNFLTAGNIFNIWRQMAVVAVLGIGMTLVILIGGIDLSVGSVLFLAAGMTAVLLRDGTPTPLAILAGLIAGAAVGLLNGVLVEVAGISPVIATLGSLIGIRGLALVFMNNAQVRVTDKFFEAIAVTRTPGIDSIKMPGLQLMVVFVFLLYIVVAAALRQTRFGRYLYAIGGNPIAARLCGLPVMRVKVLAYTLSGFFAAIGGMLMAASQGVIGPGIGVGLEFYAVAAVVLGGTRLSGGVGRVEKTLLGAMIVYMVLNYMTLRHIPAIWQQAVTGLLVLAAVVIDQLAQRGRE